MALLLRALAGLLLVAGAVACGEEDVTTEPQGAAETAVEEPAEAPQEAAEETPKDEVLADIERLLDELGWTYVELTPDGGWTRITAEHDDWVADLAVTAIRDDEGTMLEGGFSRRG